jgi:phage major head subunit gpT-like protein
MAVMVRSNAELANDNTWNEWSDQLAGMFFDEDTQKNRDEELLNSLFVVKKSDRFAEKAGTFGSLGNFTEKTEGQDSTEDEFEQGYFNLLQHSTFTKDVVMSREWAEDAQIEMMAQRAKAMVRAYKRSQAQFASDLLTGGDAESITYEGKTYSTKGGDNKAIFAPDHPLKTSKVISGGTSVAEVQSNVFTNKIGSGANAAVLLNRYANIMRNFKDDRGHVLGLLADTIVIPGNAYILEDTVKKIIGSDGETGTNYNDINTQRGKWTLVVDHLWTPNVTQANMPCIIMSSEANKDFLGSTFWNRVGLDIKSEIKTSSRNLLYNGYSRWSAGFYNWRHVIMAGSAAEGATTLT